MRLLLVGRKGWKYEAALSTYESMKYRDAVHFSGFVSDEELARIYASSEALCYVPYFEGFGLPLVEAMKSETAIVCSNVSSLPEVVGDAALMLDPHDIEGMAEAMRSLWQDQNLRSKLIRNGIKQEKKFSWDKSAKQTWEILEQQIQKKQTP